MKRDTLCAVAGATLVWLLALPTTAADESYPRKSSDAVFAICRVETRMEPRDANRTISIQPGMGDGGFPVSTASPNAQQWFNYGIKMFHAFYHDDARRAFGNAVAADSHCALCLWGQALSRGPTMNFDAEADDLKSGLEIAKRAQAQARTARDKLLTAAMVKRYSRPQDVAAERDFAADLIKAEKVGPATPDLRLLASEVLLTAWKRGDHATAAQAIGLIEAILRSAPQNTAA